MNFDFLSINRAKISLTSDISTRSEASKFLMYFTSATLSYYFTQRVPPVHTNDTGSTWNDTIGSEIDTDIPYMSIPIR